MTSRVVRLKAGEALSAEIIGAIAADVRAGHVVAFPTDTVYGIGTTALLREGARRVYRIKGRDFDKPLPVLVPSIEEAKKWVEWNSRVDVLARRFWPGPLTLALRPTPAGEALVTGGASTLALRVPGHPAILGILESAGVPLASTSANMSGRPAISSGDRIEPALGDRLDWIVDAGPVSGVESTVVDASGAEVRVLREGALGRDAVFQALKNIF